jgi:hypothetical protein
MRNEPPPQPVQCAFTCLGILPDNPLLLAGATVLAWWDVQRLDQGDDVGPKLVRGRFLRNAAAHALDQLVRASECNLARNAGLSAIDVINALVSARLVSFCGALGAVEPIVLIIKGKGSYSGVH